MEHYRAKIRVRWFWPPRPELVIQRWTGTGWATRKTAVLDTVEKLDRAEAYVASLHRREADDWLNAIKP